jgi:adenine-specific DNA-methyltransferase
MYIAPTQYEQNQLDAFEDNIKFNRTSDDLVTQIMLDWGFPLHYKIEQVQLADKELFNVQNDTLLCCFHEGIDEAFVKEVAKLKLLRIVFRDKSFKDDTAKENAKQLLKQLSPDSEMKVI